MFQKILIANRGEIACRVMRTAKALGVTCVAIYSDPDESALHVQRADKAYRVGPAPSRESYLNIPRIIEIAKQTQCEAIHPGYGFLSENPLFAKACAEAGIIFIGPSVEALIAMGSKQTAKQLLENSEVPLLPGYQGKAQDLPTLSQAADTIGYPVLIKPAAGGGGKGMHVVNARDEFAEALARAQREATASFNDATVIIEKYLQKPRHIEVQIFGDTHGNVVHLFERDCSLQRRHQKIIEETPAQHLPPAIRQALCHAAIKVAEKIKYVGAGTVEFLLDANQQFYFMEMNTRLQVEHPVTEKITGFDLVAWQLQIALGERLPVAQEDIQAQGHAIELRLCAEDTHHDFFPASGQLQHLVFPTENKHVRIDSGLTAGQIISPFYDSMIAKIILWDETRSACIHRAKRALAETQLLGVNSNCNFLQAMLQHPQFQKAEVNTHFIEENNTLLQQADAPTAEHYVLAALLYQRQLQTSPSHIQSPWEIKDNWHLNLPRQQTVIFKGHTGNITVLVQAGNKELVCHLSGLLPTTTTLLIQSINNECSHFHVVFDNHTAQGNVIWREPSCHLFIAGFHYELTLWDPARDYQQQDQKAGHLQAPMPGSVVAIFVEPGQRVRAGERLIVIEAMKMEHTIHAPADGIVSAIYFKVGQQVMEGAELIAMGELDGGE
jgi:3-methylcrotonyl-CoA carboxylase alpha subunit